LWGDSAAATCGWWGEELGITDEDGRIVIEEYYPEEWVEVYFWPDDEEDPIWSTDPFRLTGTVRVELKE